MGRQLQGWCSYPLLLTLLLPRLCINITSLTHQTKFGLLSFLDSYWVQINPESYYEIKVCSAIYAILNLLYLYFTPLQNNAEKNIKKNQKTC